MKKKVVTKKTTTKKVVKAVSKTPKVMGRCMGCKAQRQMEKPKQVKMKNGRPAVKGTCIKCGTSMYRIGSID